MKENMNPNKKSSVKINKLNDDERIKSILAKSLVQYKNSIKVIGVGGAGNNILNWLYKKGIQGAETIAINTDAHHLEITDADKKVLLGKTGRGCNGNPAQAEKIALSEANIIRKLVKKTKVVFVCAGLGGGTGTGISPVIAEIAKSENALVIGMVTLPFNIERARISKAFAGLEKLQKVVDTVMIVDNNRLVQIAGHLPVQQAFAVANELFSTSIKSMVETVTIPSLVNIDFDDLNSIAKNSGLATFGVGASDQNNRVEESVKGALSNPLLDVSYEDVSGVIIHVSGGPDMTLDEISKIGELVTENMNDEASVIWGASVNENMSGKLTVLVMLFGVKSKFHFQIDNDSKKVSLENLNCEFFVGKQISKTGKKGTPYIRISDLSQTGYINNVSALKVSDTKLSDKIIREGDVLIARRFTSNYRPAIARTVDDGSYASNNLIVVRPKNSSLIMPDYLRLFMRSKEFSKIIRNYITTTTIGESINISNLKKLEIPVPSLKEQTLYVENEGRNLELNNTRTVNRISVIMQEFAMYQTVERIMASTHKIAELFELCSFDYETNMPSHIKKLERIPDLLSAYAHIKEKHKLNVLKDIISRLKKIRNPIVHEFTENNLLFQHSSFIHFIEKWIYIIEDFLIKEKQRKKSLSTDLEEIFDSDGHLQLPKNKSLEFIEIKNPYVKGTALTKDQLEVFKGRQDVFDFISSNFEKSKRENVILLVGPRRTGKTSTLNLLGSNISDKYLPVFIDLQGGCNEGLSTFFEGMAYEIQDVLERKNIIVETPPSKEFESRPMFTFERKFLKKEVESKIGRKKIIIMFDEFEALDQAVKKNKIDKIVFDNLRHLMQHSKSLRFIFSGTHKLEDEFLSDYWSFLFQMVDYYPIGYLDKKYSFELIQEPVKKYNLFYEKEALNKIYKYSGGHPYVTQFMCWHLVDLHNKNKKNILTSEDIDVIAEKIVIGQYELFNYIWGDSSIIGSSSKRFKEKVSNITLLSLAHLLKDKEYVFAADIVNYLYEQYNYKLSLDEIKYSLDNLFNKYIIEKKVKTNGWCFKLDILRLWINKTKNIEEELEKTSTSEIKIKKEKETKDVISDIYSQMVSNNVHEQHINKLINIILAPGLIKIDANEVKNIIQSSKKIKIEKISDNKIHHEMLMHFNKRQIPYYQSELKDLRKKLKSIKETKNKLRIESKIKSYKEKLSKSKTDLDVQKNKKYIPKKEDDLIKECIKTFSSFKKIKGIILCIESNWSAKRISSFVKQIQNTFSKKYNIAIGVKILRNTTMKISITSYIVS